MAGYKGQQGRKPLPENVKRLRGTLRDDRVNDEAPTPPPPPPGKTVSQMVPAWVGKGRARTHWRAIAPVLERMGVLNTSDITALGMLCEVLAEWAEARAIVRELGMTYVTTTAKAHTRRVLAGDDDPEEDEDVFDPTAFTTMIRPRPEVAIAADAWRRAKQMLQEFGMTPSAITRLKVEQESEGDEFDEVFGRAAR